MGRPDQGEAEGGGVMLGRSRTKLHLSEIAMAKALVERIDALRKIENAMEKGEAKKLDISATSPSDERTKQAPGAWMYFALSDLSMHQTPAQSLTSFLSRDVALEAIGKEIMRLCAEIERLGFDV